MYKDVELSHILNDFYLDNFCIDKIKEKVTRKNRIVYKINSFDNFFCLKQMYIDKDRVLLIYSFLEWLNFFDFSTPRLVKSKTSSPFLEFNNKLFVMCNWIEGRKLNYLNINECINAISTLSRIHSKSYKFSLVKESDFRDFFNVNQKYSKSLNELEKLHTISQSIKDEFSCIFLYNYSKFYYLVYISSSFSYLINFKNLPPSICHGDFVNKNVLINKNKAIPIDFDKIGINYSIYDLSYFLRRFLRKEYINWNFSLCLKLIHQYEKSTPLFIDDFFYLISYLSFPQKMFKISKHYFNNFSNLTKIQKESLKNALLKICSSLDNKLNFLYDFNNYIRSEK